MSEIAQDDFYKIGTSFKRPIPGESLTRSPEDQNKWDQPPAITDPQEASRFFLEKLTEPKVYNSLLDSIEEGTPLMDLSQVLMYQAYRDGVINPDLVMILTEQVVYMMAALAERQGIDFVIQEDDEEDIAEQEREQAMAENMPEELTEQLEETELPERTSLLAPPSSPVDTVGET